MLTQRSPELETRDLGTLQEVEHGAPLFPTLSGPAIGTAKLPSLDQSIQERLLQSVARVAAGGSSRSSGHNQVVQEDHHDPFA